MLTVTKQNLVLPGYDTKSPLCQTVTGFFDVDILALFLTSSYVCMFMSEPVSSNNLLLNRRYPRICKLNNYVYDIDIDSLLQLSIYNKQRLQSKYSGM